ncbi:MAG: CoA-binding protein [Chloroflexi bacterium]|nr:CoA-binding protein [Chloroflexota bacterium]
MKTVAVIGASSDRTKFGNKAVRAFAAAGYRVVPIHPQQADIEGLRTYRSVLDVPGIIHMATLYVPPSVGEGLLDELAAKGIVEVWVNPGTESDTLIARAQALGLQPIQACSITGLGLSPGQF